MGAFDNCLTTRSWTLFLKGAQQSSAPVDLTPSLAAGKVSKTITPSRRCPCSRESASSPPSNAAR